MGKTTLTVLEVSDYLGVCTDTVYNMVREKQIPFIKVRRRIFFRRETIDQWMSQHEDRNMDWKGA